MSARWWLLLAALSLSALSLPARSLPVLSLLATAQAEPPRDDAGAQTPSADGGTDAKPASASPNASPNAKPGASQIKTSLERAEVAVGELAKLKLEVDAPSSMQVAVSEQPMGSLELVHRDVQAEEHDGRTRTTVTLSLLTFEPGEVTIPALSVRAIAQNGEFEHLESTPQKLRVSSLIANEPNAEPKGLTKPITVEQDDYTLAWVGLALLGAVVVALSTLYTARYLRNRPVPPAPLPPPRPPWELAFERLEGLARQKAQLIAEERGEVFVDGVSDAVREYLGRRYGFDGLESTTGEALATLERLRPEKLSLSGVSLLLEQCDLVKFARAVPDAEQCDDLFNGAVGLVRATTPDPIAQPVAKAEEPKS
jgi:hypothetical protein